MDSLRDKFRRVNKYGLLVSIVGAFLIALLITAIFGSDKFEPRRTQDGKIIPAIRGEPRRHKRHAGDTTTVTSSSPSDLKDPFAIRPRIQTRNGHLVFESSRDKNIEFRTNGQRGTVTINGVKLDQLFSVAKALDKSHRLLKSNSSASALLMDGVSIDNHYDVIVSSILTSGQRLSSLERLNSDLRANLTALTKKLSAFGRRLSKRTSQLKSLSLQIDQIETKLKENDCFDANGQPVCKNGAMCIDSYGTFKCLCPDQYEGPTCEKDVDECAKFRGTDLGCQNGAKCNNFPGGYSCECPPNYHGVHCTEKHDDCALSSSATLCGHGKCVNLARMVPNQARYECICDQGWTTDPSTSSPACVSDINECIVSNGPGSGNISLPSQAYPCSQNPFVECINLPGSFECGPCPPGFTGNGRVCRDIDECAKDNGGCSTTPFVECINTLGSRRCGPCPPGYAGDGQECKQVSVCSQDNGGCHRAAKCIELTGVSASSSRLCVCEYPYTSTNSNGVGPQGCRLVSSPGWVATNFTQDDCNPNPCLKGAKCRRTDSSFECICMSGYAGRLCDQEADLTCGGVFASSEGAFTFPVGGSYARLIELSKNATEANGSAKTPAKTDGQRHYECRWTIKTTASDKSLRLTFSNVADKLNPTRSIQVWLAGPILGQSAHGADVPVSQPFTNSPTCSERLDVRERLQAELVATGAEGRLMARICTHGPTSASSSSPTTSTAHLSRKNSNISMTIDASAVDLLYSFSATKTQFADPSLAFTVNWTQTEPTCGGPLPVVDSGSLASPQFPEFYPAGIKCRYILRVPPGKRIRIQFGELTLRYLHQSSVVPTCMDSLTLIDGSVGSDRPILFKHCGQDQDNRSKITKTIVSSSSTVELELTTMRAALTPLLRPKQQKGFYLTYSSEPATPGCGGLYTAKQATIASDDYEPSKSILDKGERETAAYITGHFVTQQQQIQQQQQQQQQKIKAKFRPNGRFGAPNVGPYKPPTDSTSDQDTDSFEVLNEIDLNHKWQATQYNTGVRSVHFGKRDTGNQKPITKVKSSSDTPGTYTKRCEYEIRPEHQRRNHRIQIDALDMLGADIDAKERLNRSARRNRCDYTRLLVYDGVPTAGEVMQQAPSSNNNATKDRSTNTYFAPTSSGPASSTKEAISNSNLLATFCGSDVYDYKHMQSIVSTGHVMYLVYETRYDPLAPRAPASAINYPYGFSLRYSTICSGTYRQLSGEILTELDEFVNDCVYHIALPPNNTISLSIEPKDGVAGEQAMTLPNGSCAIQAMFFDGAMQRGWSTPDQRQERVLSFPVGASANSFPDPSKMALDDVPFVPDDQVAIIGTPDGPSAESNKSRIDDFSDLSDTPLSASSAGGGQKHTRYWQYASSPVQDVKLFDVCHIQALTFESIWNHVSLRFRLVDNLQSAGSDSGSLDGDDNGAGRPQVSQFQLVIKYQSEAACGGIIGWPPQGNITLIASQSIKSLDKYPLTVGRWEQLHRNGFTNQCSWILRNKLNHLISLKFKVPVDEIEARTKAWLEWKRQGRKKSKPGPGRGPQKSSTHEDSQFNCTDLFVETIELYEPNLNRSRILCPSDLVGNFIDEVFQIKWTTQSDTLYVRLHNNSEPAVKAKTNDSSDYSFAKLRKPLSGNITMVYTLEETMVDAKCGGRLLVDKGVIRSPRWPLHYPPHVQCIWHIDTGKQQQIRLNFSYFQLGPCPGDKNRGSYDVLDLLNGPVLSSPLIGRFCGSQLQSRVITSQSNQLLISFLSGGIETGGRFEIQFDAAQTGCGGSLTTSVGTIDSPNYPQPSGHNYDCEWTIQVSQSNTIVLWFNDLDIRSALADTKTSVNVSSDCILNGPDASYVEIFDSSPADATASKSLGRFCHRSQLKQNELNTRSNKVWIKYRSQALDVGHGFRFSYGTRCNPGYPLTGTYGVIESPGYPAKDYFLSCKWVIRAPIGSNITIVVSDLNMISASKQRSEGGQKCEDDYIRVVPASLVSNSRALGTANSSNSSTEWKLCGMLEDLGENERTIVIPSNQAIVEYARPSYNFEISTLRRSFRFEWQAHGCGWQQLGGESIRPIEFDERVNLTSFTNHAAILDTGIECLYIIDMSRSPWVGSFELQVNSDLRTSAGSASISSNEDVDKACNRSSLIIYDGLDNRAPVLLRNCDGTFKSHESVITSNNQVLIRYYVKPTAVTAKTRHDNGLVQFGTRNFQITAWPAGRIGCLTSVFGVATPYNQIAGTLKSPKYPDLYPARDHRCYGTVSAKAGRVKITIDELDIPVSVDKSESDLLDDQQCQKSLNFLALANRHDLVNAKYLCGKYNAGADSGTKGRTEFVTSGSGGSIEFESHDSLQGRWKLTYSRLCGLEVIVQSSRDFASPNYPNRPNWVSLTGSGNDAASSGLTDRVCIWHIKARPTQFLSARRIHLQVVNFVESPHQSSRTNTSDCLRVYEGTQEDLRTSRFNLTQLDSGQYKSSQVIKVCKQADLRHNNWYYLSKGNELTVLMSGEAIAKVRANTFENYCGGDMSLDAGEFASPNFPLPYGPDLDCFYIIHGAPGSKISLNIVKINLPKPTSNETDSEDEPNCDNVDHLEVRTLIPDRRLAQGVSRLGKKSPMNSRRWMFSSLKISKTTTTTTTTQKPTIKRRGDNATTAIDRIQQDTANLTVLTSLASRLDLLSRIDSIYRGPIGNDGFEPDDDDFLAKYVSDAEASQLSLSLDEFIEGSKLIGRLCGGSPDGLFEGSGIKMPRWIKLFGNERMLLRFRSHGASSGGEKPKSSKESGFLVNYKITYGGDKSVVSNKFGDYATEFSSQEDVNAYIKNSGVGSLIASPQYPSLQRLNTSIVWSFEAPEGHVIQFEVVAMQIGDRRQDCADDSLSIYDDSRASQLRLAKLCGALKYNDKARKEGRRKYSKSSNGQSVQDWRRNVESLMPSYEAHNPLVRSALIKRIRSSKNRATVVYDNFKTESMFLLRYSAVSLKEAKLQDGNDTVIDESEVLQDEFDRRVTIEEDPHSKMDPSKVSKTCTNRFELISDNGGNRSSVSFGSPFSTISKDIVECQWLVYTRENRQLQFKFEPPVAYLYDESLDSDDVSLKRQSDYCLDRDYKGQTRQYVMVYDGATHLAPQIARFCLPAPPIALSSTGRHLFIRYIQVSTSPPKALSKRSKGFKMTVQLERCGGQHHVLSSLRLKDRYDSSKNYSNNLDCTYHLLAKRPDFVLLVLNQVSEFHLAPTPTDANCTVGDYIEIRDVPMGAEDTVDFSHSLTGRSLGRYCAGRPLEYIESPGMAIAIHFHTDLSNTGPGFELSVMSAHPRLSCPRGYQALNASEPFGLLTSPNWPHGFLGKRHCKYQLVAPMESSVELSFIRLNRDGATGFCRDNLNYLADNEASALRYSSSPLRETQSPIGGTLIQKLVRAVPCSYHSPGVTNPVLPGRWSGNTGSTTDQYGIEASPVDSFATISSEDYQRLMDSAFRDLVKINSGSSHILLLDYEAQDLAPDRGFIAVYKLIDHAQANLDTDADASEVGDKQSQSTTNPFCGGSNVMPGSMLRSGKFGLAMDESDEYIQCEWKLKLDTSDIVEDMYFSLSKMIETNGTAGDEFILSQSASIGTFTSSYLVFQVFEVPSLSEKPYVEERWYSERNSDSNEACGLNRLMVSEFYKHDAFFACGNHTDSYRVLYLEQPVNLVSLRTKNLAKQSPPSSSGRKETKIFYRGLLAYFHENECLLVERTIGEFVRIRSHLNFNRSLSSTQTATNQTKLQAGTSYKPGVCRWQLHLKPGTYEITFAGIYFRPPEGPTVGNNSTECPDNEDFLETRASTGPYAPALERYCYRNQKTVQNGTSKHLVMDTIGELTVLFAAGLNQLAHGLTEFKPTAGQPQQGDSDVSNSPASYGFDIRIRRIRESTLNDFCTPKNRHNIYTFITSADFSEESLYSQSSSLRTFLYPKNAHCVVTLMVDEDWRFKMKFRGFFDIEPSKGCQNDYVQLDELILTTAQNTSSTEAPATKARPTTSKAPDKSASKSKTTSKAPFSTTTTIAPLNTLRPYQKFDTKLIGRYCGRDRPEGEFETKGNKLRITFHSNDNSIVGKGFNLELGRA